MKNTTRLCSIDGCGKAGKIVRGWCTTHYARWWQHGDPLWRGEERYHNPEEAFNARTEWQGDCLIWTGSLRGGGYGEMTVDKKSMSAHRYAWERENGKIPKGAFIDHKCWNRACVNAKHLRLADRGQNASYLDGPYRTNRSSGVRNVYRNRKGWQVQIGKNGKAHYFGVYSSLDEAKVVAEQRRAELFGEFAGKG